MSLSPPRHSTTAWERGAVGEERLGARLNRLAGDGVAVLHDRRVPGTRANIDHLVVTTARVWVIDAKRYKGRPERRVDGGLLKPRTQRLLVGGRDRSRLIDGIRKQVILVGGTAEVAGALCFVEADWPLLSHGFDIDGVHVVSPRRLVRLITGDPSGLIDVARMRASLADRFPPA